MNKMAISLIILSLTFSLGSLAYLNKTHEHATFEEFIRGLGIPMLASASALKEETILDTITYIPTEYSKSTETNCKIENKRKICNKVLYSGTRFAQDKNGNWVDPSEVLGITRDSDDLIFHYDGIEGNFNITFETGVFYNNNYYSMYDVKQLQPQIQFNFPTKNFIGTRKYAVNITNISIIMQSNIQNQVVLSQLRFGMMSQAHSSL